MVISPHGLVAFADPFQLSLGPETSFAEPTGSLYPLPVLLLGSSYGHFVSEQVMQSLKAVFISELTT